MGTRGGGTVPLPDLYYKRIVEDMRDLNDTHRNTMPLPYIALASSPSRYPTFIVQVKGRIRPQIAHAHF